MENGGWASNMHTFVGENAANLEFTQQVVHVDFLDNIISVTEEFVNCTADSVNSRYKGDLPCRQITTSLPTRTSNGKRLVSVHSSRKTNHIKQ